MITTSTDWSNAVNKAATDSYPIIRLYYGDESSYIALSTKDVTFDSVDYMGLLKNSPTVNESFNIHSHKHSISNLTLSIINYNIDATTIFSDYIETMGSGTDIGFYNRLCEIKLVAGNVSTYTNAFMLFKGIIRDIQHDKDIVKITIEDYSSLKHRKLPRTVLNSTDYSNAQEDNLGEPIPIAIGDVDRCPGLMTVSQYTNDTAIPTISFDDSTYNFGLKTFDTEGSPSRGPLYVLNNKKYIPIRIDTNKEYSESLGDCNIVFDQGIATTLDNEFTVAASQIAIGYDGIYGSGGLDGSWSNMSNIIDGDTSTYAERSGSGRLDSGAAQTLNLIFPAFGGDMRGLGCSIYTFCKLITSGGSNIGVACNFEGNTFLTKGTFNNIDGGSTFLQSEISGANTVDERNNYIYTLYVTPDTGGDDAWTLQIYEVGATWIFIALDFSKWEWYADLTGRKDSPAGLYTGSANALVEIPTDAMLNIVNSDMSVSYSDINTAEFSTARGAGYLSGWKHAYSVNKIIDSKTLIEEIGKESKSFPFFRADGDFNLKTIKDTYSSSDRTIENEDIFKISFKRSPLKDIKTKVIVHYKYDYGNSSYLLTTTAAENADAQTKYNTSAGDSTLEVEAKYIRDTTTANSYRDYLLNQWKQPHNIVTVDLPVRYTDLELGDIIEFSGYTDNVFGESITANATRMSQTIYKYWFITGIKRGINKINIKAFQLHDVS